MSKASRGGLTLKTGKIGRCNVLRQQIMMPGERMNVNISGSVRLEALRERDVMRINAHLGVFMTPLRWLWSDFPTYLKEGPDTAQSPPSTTEANFSKYGIGARDSGLGAQQLFKPWMDAPLRCYNEWYKFPEDPDVTTWDDDGEKAVPLSKAWSRCRYTVDPDASADYTVSSATNFDVRELAKTQAKFRSAMKRDILSYNRWIELIKETYNGDGSREVDQVPIMLDQVEVGVNPRELPASDGASLGQWQSLYDFNVNHSIRGITAPEHCIITYILTVRFGSIIESVHPLARDGADWHTLTADPEYISAAEPVEVQVKDVAANNSATSLGYLPAGWQWRSDSDVLGYRIDDLESFPYMEFPTTQANAKDATRIKNAFRSSRLGDYLVDVYFQEESNQPIGTSMDSYFSGMLDDVKGKYQSNDEFPKGGKML
jgi:hypothetical protein